MIKILQITVKKTINQYASKELKKDPSVDYGTDPEIELDPNDLEKKRKALADAAKEIFSIPCVVEFTYKKITT